MTRAALLALILAAPAAAAADALPPPEDITCRDGERVVTDHGGTRCELPWCETDADCPDGARCPAMRCVAYVENPAEMCRPGAHKEPPDPCAPIAEDRGPCRDAEPRCDGDARCQRSQCEWVDAAPPRPAASEAPAEDQAPPTASSGGGCCGSGGARARGLAPVLSLILFGAALILRRA